jgi:hypothetical protein
MKTRTAQMKSPRMETKDDQDARFDWRNRRNIARLRPE